VIETGAAPGTTAEIVTESASPAALAAAPAAAPPAVPSTPHAVDSVDATAAAPPAAQPRTTLSGEARAVWGAATQAGASLGRSSTKGAVATAGFFTRISKSVADSF
jgi:hypothetical protein